MVPKTTGWNGEHTLPISTPSMPLGYSGPWCLTAYPSPMQIPGNQATCYVGLERYWYWVIGQYSQILDSIASGGYFFVATPNTIPIRQHHRHHHKSFEISRGIVLYIFRFILIHCYAVH